MPLVDRLRSIETRIANACEKASRPRGSVKLIAVSKLQPISAIEEAYALGVRDFGENYVQELAEKRTALAHLKDARWHLIGSLQTNKVKAALEHADYFHALDSKKLADEIQKRAQKPIDVLIQVNIDGESAKSGIAPNEIISFAESLRSLDKLNVKGLMCIPEPRERMRPTFAKMRELARSISDNPELSMGMSHDFEDAILEGATWVRIGTAIFGERKK